jgi:starvation-inducible DNA-binding protein
MRDKYLASSLKELQANVLVFSHLVQGFYWNTESVLMRQSRIVYEEMYRKSAKHVDEISNWLRRLDEEAPYTLEEFITNSSLGNVKPDTYCGVEMAMHLQPINNVMVNDIKFVIDQAILNKEHGLANYLSELLTDHQEWDWFLKSSLKLPPNPWKSLKD